MEQTGSFSAKVTEQRRKEEEAQFNLRKVALRYPEILEKNMTWGDIVRYYQPEATEEEIESIYWGCYNKICKECRTSNPTGTLILRELQYGYFKAKSN